MEFLYRRGLLPSRFSMRARRSSPMRSQIATAHPRWRFSHVHDAQRSRRTCRTPKGGADKSPAACRTARHAHPSSVIAVNALTILADGNLRQRRRLPQVARPSRRRPTVWLATTILPASLRLNLQGAPTRRHFSHCELDAQANAAVFMHRQCTKGGVRVAATLLAFMRKPAPSLSIFYAQMGILARRTPTIHDEELEHVVLHDIASNGAEPGEAKRASKPASARAVRHPPQRRKGFFSSVFDALVDSRMRRAEIEIEHHRRFYEGCQQE